MTKDEIEKLLVEIGPSSAAGMRDAIIQLLQQLHDSYRDDTPEGKQARWATDRAISTIKLGYNYVKYP